MSDPDQHAPETGLALAPLTEEVDQGMLSPMVTDPKHEPAEPLRFRLGLLGRFSFWWLNRRGLTVLYRGQRVATKRILSPLAQTDPGAAKALIELMRSLGLSDGEIAGYAPQWHGYPVPPIAAPPGLAGKPLGAVGITTSRLIGLAVHFAAGGVVQVIRVPAGLAHPPFGWPCLELEAEYVVLDEIMPGVTARTLKATSLPSLRVNEKDHLVLGS